MKTNYVLVDCENVHDPTISALKAEHFRVLLFLGPNNAKLKKDLVLGAHQLHDRLDYVEMEGSGKNSLDFHIAYYLGMLAKEDPEGYFHVISKDKGFNPLIQHLKSKQIVAARSESIEAMPCMQPGKKPAATPECTDETKLLEKVVSDLRKRKTSRPASLKTLQNFIHTVCGKELPVGIIDSVYNAFLKTSYIKVDGTKVHFIGL